MTDRVMRLYTLYCDNKEVVRDTVVGFTQALRSAKNDIVVEDLKLLRKIHMQNPALPMSEFRIKQYIAGVRPTTEHKKEPLPGARKDRLTAAKARLRKAAWQSDTFTVKHFYLVAPKVTSAMRSEFPEDLHDAVAAETRSLFERETPPPEGDLAKALAELTGCAATSKQESA